MFSQHDNLTPDLSGATLRWLNELAIQGILTTDTDLRIVGWNRWLEQHSGRGAESVLGQPLFAIYPDLLSRGIGKHYQQALTGQIVVLAQRLHRYLLPMLPSIEGTSFTQMQQSIWIAPLTSDDHIVGTITVISDVTERVFREEQLKQQIEELEALQASLQEAVREREAFVSIASHELKTPLTGLLGHSYLMRRKAMRTEHFSPQALQSLDTIIAQAERLNTMLASLLDVSRVQTGQLSIERVSLDLIPLVQRVVEEQSVNLARHTIMLSKPDEPVIVEADEGRLTQVFNNLLNNAIKYSPHGGEISMSLVADDKQASVAITDSGIGIPPAAQRNLFQRFFRADRQSTAQAGGLGIGLYVVKEIVTQHGGTISVQSTEGVGSTFTVHLPLCNS